MRTPTDSPTDQFGNLGAPVRAPAPTKPEWRPTDTPGIERNSDGRLRTNAPAPTIPAPVTPAAAPEFFVLLDASIQKLVQALRATTLR